MRTWAGVGGENAAARKAVLEQPQEVADGFLKQLRPTLETRGLRIQPYAD
jgi:hypothetical protein